MYKKIMNGSILFLLVCLAFINVLYLGEEVDALDRRGENLIRFHVLANSDSPEDQSLKLMVRDAVIEEMSLDMSRSENIEETRSILNSNLERIKDRAVNEIKANGYDYDVKISLEDHPFPTKRYGDVVFPAGIYEALRVEIGEAKGQNWWCVMFPPLCFVDVKHGLTDEATKNALKESLTEDEFHLIYSNVNEDELPLQLKSKLFSVFEDSKEDIKFQLSRLASILQF